jgi:hypothetical protein
LGPHQRHGWVGRENDLNHNSDLKPGTGNPLPIPESGAGLSYPAARQHRGGEARECASLARSSETPNTYPSWEYFSNPIVFHETPSDADPSATTGAANTSVSPRSDRGVKYLLASGQYKFVGIGP